MSLRRQHDLSIVFMANILYPHGMAETKRIQHAIDLLMAREGVYLEVLLLRQRHTGRDEDALTGVYKGIPYRTIGTGLELTWKIPFNLIKYFIEGLIYLHCCRNRGRKNLIYAYKDPSIENVIFLLYARFIGYKVIFDITEDCDYAADSPHLLSKVKLKTSQVMSRHIRLFADAVIVNSSHLFRKFECVSNGQFPVVLRPISVNFEYFDQSPQAYHSPIRILYSGSFADKDGVENLIDAFEKVSRRHQDTKLILTGKGLEENLAKIRAKISEKPPDIVSKFELKGYLPDEEYYRLLNGCDILCMTRIGSKFANAGFPFKLGEYLATGKPVLASAVSDVRDFLEHRTNAVLVEPDCVDSIVLGLEFLITHPQEAFRIGAAGKDVALRQFDFRLHGRQLFELFDDL